MFYQIKITRLVTQWLISSFGIYLLVILLPGVTVNGWISVLETAAVIGLLNALLWPLLMQFALPVTVATLGLASLVLNGIVVYLVSQVLPGFSVSDFWSAVGFAFGLTVLNTIFHQLLVINDDETYYRNVIKRQA